VNLFVLGWSSSGSRIDVRSAEAALRGLLARIPFFDAADLETWSAPSGVAALASVAHRPEQTRGVRYVHREVARMACFSGRPFRWIGDAEADGRAPLDPRFYLAPVEDWMDTLDGRVVVARYEDATRALDLWTDPMGAYPLFATERAGVRWISNNAEILHTLSGSDAQNPTVLASLLGGGWSLGGHPRWADVKRLPCGLVRFRPGAPDAHTELLPTQRISALYGAGWDPQEAAAILVTAFRGLADWPGRPNVVPITGGRDSRLLLAAALRSGLDFTAITTGTDDDPDVVIGRLLCQTVSISHETFPPTALPHGALYTEPQRAARMLDLVCSGTASLEDAPGLPLGPRDGPLELWHIGHGGELARLNWGHGDGLDRDGLVRYLLRIVLSRRPWRPDFLSPEGRYLVESRLRHWVDELLEAGVAPVDVPAAFHFLEHWRAWAGPTHGCTEWVRDTTSPLWSPRLLPHMLGPPVGERAHHMFHLRMLETLAPELVDVPFGEPPFGWPALQPGRRRRTEHVLKRAGQVVAELRRRGPRRLRPRSSSGLPTGLLTLVRERALAQREHPAWAVLDAARVERLLTREPDSLDPVSARSVWRLATVFLAEPEGRSTTN
jgi:hypothetical protein